MVRFWVWWTVDSLCRRVFHSHLVIRSAVSAILCGVGFACSSTGAIPSAGDFTGSAVSSPVLSLVLRVLRSARPFCRWCCGFCGQLARSVVGVVGSAVSSPVLSLVLRVLSLQPPVPKSACPVMPLPASVLWLVGVVECLQVDGPDVSGATLFRVRLCRFCFLRRSLFSCVGCSFAKVTPSRRWRHSLTYRRYPPLV